MTKWSLSIILSDLVLAIVINTSATFLSGASFAFETWYPGTASAFFTNVLLQLILPVPAAGRLASKPLANSIARPLLSVFVENLIFVTCISFTMAWINTAGSGVIDTWLSTYVQLVLVGYITSLILYVIASKAAKPSS